jgi:hypothetical protein
MPPRITLFKGSVEGVELVELVEGNPENFLKIEK